jgi:N-acetylneuraminic acid mutarotase
MNRYRSVLSSLLATVLGFGLLSPSAAAQTTAFNEWAWMGGSSVLSCTTSTFNGILIGANCGKAGVYGTVGTPSAGNIAGSRSDASSWTDSSGNFWLFAGGGYDANGNSGYLNDLWEFNPATSEWEWVSGSSTVGSNGGQPGVYGTLGTPAAGNTPGGRTQATSWTDNSGNFWVFGGIGSDPGGSFCDLNDLWRFNPSTKEWTWMSGSNAVKQPGVYGTLGKPAAGNTPGGRCAAASWTDNRGDFWLFGGDSTDSNDNVGLYNDLWEFNPSTNEWTWMGGSNTLGTNYAGGVLARPGVYGTLATPAAGNNPGGRENASGWTDRNGNFWLFGGWGADASGINGAPLNDLWEFNPLTNEWAWMGGNSTMSCGTYGCGQPGVYGTLGTPAAGNVPGGRYLATSWTDSVGNLWLFGGLGKDSVGPQGYLNDLWELNPSTNEWTWMGGNSTIGSGLGQSGLYGTLGIPSAGNAPGGREVANIWADSRGYIWLFGGDGSDANGNFGTLNDLWEYASFPLAATPTFSVPTGTYSTMQTVTISDATAGATIYYTTNGTTPNASSTAYGGPILVASTETLAAVAIANGYVASAVATAIYTIPPDFTLAINPASVSVQSGQSGTTTIVVQDEGGFNGNVSFACSGLPQGAGCSFAIDPVPTPAGITYFILTVTTSSTTAALHRNYNPLFPGTALATVLCCFGLKKRRRSQTFVLLGLCVIGLGLLAGCGTSAPPPPVTSTVTVTATSGALQHTTTFSLTVN